MRHLALWLLCFSMPTAVEAGFIIDVRPATLAPGSLGFVDVYISSSVGETNNLSLVDFRFKIVPVGLPSGQVYFRDSFSQADPNNPSKQNNSEQTDPSYVFFGKTNSTHFGATLPTVDPTDIGGADYATDPITDDLTDVPVGSTPLLLARLELAQQQTVIGDSFLVQLNTDPLLTSFTDSNSTPVSFIQSGMGPLSITAVPEPSTVLLGTLAMLVFGARASRRRHIDNNVLEPLASA
jgi:hypothetical protein